MIFRVSRTRLNVSIFPISAEAEPHELSCVQKSDSRTNMATGDTKYKDDLGEMPCVAGKGRGVLETEVDDSQMIMRR